MVTIQCRAIVLSIYVCATFLHFAAASASSSSLAQCREGIDFVKRGGFLGWLKGESSRVESSSSAGSEADMNSDSDKEANEPVQMDPLSDLNQAFDRDYRKAQMKLILENEKTERDHWLLVHKFAKASRKIGRYNQDLLFAFAQLSFIPFIHLNNSELSEQEKENNARQMILDIDNSIPSPFVKIDAESDAKEIEKQYWKNRARVRLLLQQYHELGANKSELFDKMMESAMAAQEEFGNLQAEFHRLMEFTWTL